MKKRILSLLGIIALFLGVILVSCGNDDDNKNTTGVHKIVIEQSGNTDDFDLNIAFEQPTPAELQNYTMKMANI